MTEQRKIMQFNKHTDFETEEEYYSWDDTEDPVPPEDWKPCCYDKDEKTGECKEEWFSYATEMEQCMECPYRMRNDNVS
jgi:hypothetical protein